MSEKQRKTCVVYCRTSTARQRVEETIGAQIERCKEIVERHGLEVLPYGPSGDGWIIDDGVSGGLLDGRQFSVLLQDLEAGKIRPDFLVVYSISRISRIDRTAKNIDKLKRSHADAAKIQAILIGTGVQVIDESGAQDPASLTFAIQMVLASEEYKQIRSRTMSGKARRLSEGKYARGGRPPYGYEAVYANGVDRRQSYTLVPHPEDAPRLQKILGWFIEGGVTYAARRATEEGFPTPMSSTSNRKNKAADWSPTRWSPVSVQHIVKNIRSYLGEQTLIFDNQPHILKYEPIITHELYAEVERRKKERTLKRRAVMLTTGLAVCRCGGNLHARKSSVYHYANCKDGKGECGSFRHDLLENYLWIATVARLVQILKNEGETKGNRAGNYETRIHEIEAKIVGVNASIGKLVDMMLMGLDREIFEARNRVLNDEKASLQSELARIKSEREAQARKEAQEQTLESRLRNLLLELVREEPSLERKREVLSDLLNGGRVTVFWGPRAWQGKAVRQSEWAELTFPPFGSLPAITVKIGPNFDVWNQMLGPDRVAGIKLDSSESAWGDALKEWIKRVKAGEKVKMELRLDGVTDIHEDVG